MSDPTIENQNTTGEAAAFAPPRHWLGVEELNPEYWSDPKVLEKRSQEFHDKPVETIDLIDKLDTKGIARRDFLTLMGASMAMASFACARRPVHKIIPYVVKPEEITAGVSNYYATTCAETGHAVLAKVREGRPIKLEGNPDNVITKGALDGRTQAAILDLYDMDRAKEPRRMGRGKGAKAGAWDEIDAEIAGKLKAIAAGSGRIRILSDRILSDSTQRLINEFLSSFSAGAHIQYSPISDDEVVTGQVASFGGTPVVPYYNFAKADVVVSFGADFLGDWGSSVDYSRDWATTRRVDPSNSASQKQSRLFVCESMMSITGANADERLPVRPGDELKIAAALANEVARRRGASAPALSSYSVSAVAQATGVEAARITKMAEELAAAAGRSIVVAGGLSAKTADGLSLQIVANYLNSILGNEGATVDGTSNPFIKVSSPITDVERLVQQMASGQVDAIFLHRTNPIYTLPKSMGFAEALAKVPLVIALNDREDETALASDFLLPDHHWLENWGDAQARRGVITIQQPTVSPLHSTRSFQDTLIALSKAAGLRGRGLLATAPASWHDYVKANWKETHLGAGGEAAWENVLRDGGLKSNLGSGSARSFLTSALGRVPALKAAPTGFIFGAYAKNAIGDGNRANNPWLQEMPDPITTATWDNYLNMNPTTAAKLSLAQNDVVTITANGVSLDLPLNIQPGLHPDAVTAAIGYGRTAAGKIGTGVGKDVKLFAKLVDGTLTFSGTPVEVKKTGRRYQIALTQWHNATENRPILNDITLADFRKDAKSQIHTDPHLRLDPVPTMWPKFKYPGYRWGMAIDMSTCTGCGACVIACQAENNIPVVGRDNVRRSREMHWLRIDRYYAGTPENPDVVFQPMLCQHCENAPCETVCPVLATVHDDEGLNAQVYNRCVGTRYCQNNCPYKVRRFNFFDHWKSYEGTMNLAWNPDVTVRTRGIMEKCTFCVQRIRDAKDKAKDEGRRVQDQEFMVACQQTCSTDAIVFGDINDPNSKVSKLRAMQHAFRSLEVVNTVPSISYLTKVRNKEVTAFNTHGGVGGHENHGKTPDLNPKGEGQSTGGHHE